MVSMAVCPCLRHQGSIVFAGQFPVYLHFANHGQRIIQQMAILAPSHPRSQLLPDIVHFGMAPLARQFLHAIGLLSYMPVSRPFAGKLDYCVAVTDIFQKRFAWPATARQIAM
jgi:hypothetical protein